MASKKDRGTAQRVARADKDSLELAPRVDVVEWAERKSVMALDVAFRGPMVPVVVRVR